MVKEEMPKHLRSECDLMIGPTDSFPPQIAYGSFAELTTGHAYIP